MKKFKEIVSLLLTLIILSFSFAGCKNEKESKDCIPRVALIMEGPISDMAWNSAAYKGLTEIENLGAEIDYEENVSVQMVSDIIETYIAKGFNIIYLSTNGYYDAVKSLISKYPNVQFILINGNETVDNLYSTQIAEEEQGFLMGIIAATATKTNKVGFVGGSDIPPIINAEKGFEKGVKFINENVQVFNKNLDNFKNINQAKDITKEFISNGVDVVAPICDQSAIGVIEAAEEEKIMSICSGSEQELSAIYSGLIAVEKDTSIAYVSSYKKLLEGKLENKVTKIGAVDNAIYLSDWFEASNCLSNEEKQNIQDIYSKLRNGEIKVDIN